MTTEPPKSPEPGENQRGIAATGNDFLLRTPFYCEENVWRLLHLKLEQSSSRGTPQFYVVYISNTYRRIAMHHQRASDQSTIFWDYHVILIGLDGFVYDIDSTLEPYPIPALEYLDLSFPVLREDCSRFQPLFRLIHGEVFLEYFGSDRSHMYNATTKCWNATPPSYPCIVSPKLPGENSHLFYMDFSNTMPSKLPEEAKGRILSLGQLRDFVCTMSTT